ncbi:pre-peptidase C-terminal domain-containing protein [Aquincola sp. J276]|nr:pre-peptidase C-terminal domain-containing protein [Aquincola sp. J276]
MDLRGDLTIEAWIRPDRFNGSWMPIVARSNGTAATRSYSLWLNSAGYLHLSTADANGSNRTLDTAAGSIQLGQWTHVAAVIDRSAATPQLRLYINGVLASTGTLDGQPPADNGAALMVGGALDGGLFDGAIDELRLWRGVRSAQQIDGLKGSALTGQESGLAVYLPFDSLQDGSSPSGRPGSPAASVSSLYAGLPGTLSGLLAVPGQVDTYRLTVDQRRLVVLDTLGEPYGQVKWQLSGTGGLSRGGWLANTDGHEGHTLLDLQPGVYTLTLRTEGDVRSPYALRLLPLDQAPLLTDAQPVSGELVPGSATQAHAFNAAAGERFYFDLQALALQGGRLRVLTPHGDLLVDQGLNGDAGVFEATTAGRYTVLLEGARGNADQRVAYRFALHRVQDTVLPLQIGQPQALTPPWRGSGAAAGLDFGSHWHVAVPPSPALDARRTVSMEATVTVDSFAASYMPVLYLGRGDASYGPGRSWALYVTSGGALHLSTSDGQDQYLTTANGLVKAGVATRIAATIDRVNGVMKLFVDGDEVASMVVRKADMVSSPSRGLQIGRSDESWSGLAAFDGRITDVRIWNVARTPDEIGTSSGQPVDPATPGLVLSYGLHEGAGTAVADGGPLGLHGEVVDGLAAVPGAVAGRISQPGQKATYTFEVTTPRTVVMDVLGDSGFLWSLDGPRGRLVDQRSLRNTDANDIGGLDGWSADPGASQRVVFTLVPGSYSLTIDPPGDAVGDFAFRLLDLASGLQPQPVQTGQDLTGTLAWGAMTQAHAIDVTAGDRLALDSLGVPSGHNDLRWRLIAPTGEQVYSASFASDSGTLQLQQTGRYVLLVEGGRADTSPKTYRFRVEHRGNTLAEMLPGTHWQDDFDGPQLSADWQAGRGPTTLGERPLPAAVFETLDGATVLRLQNSVANGTLEAMSSRLLAPADNFRWEVRFNTLTQAPGVAWDEPIGLYLADAVDASRWTAVALRSNPDGQGRVFRSDARPFDGFGETAFDFANNTWYRLRLEGGPGQRVRAVLLDDQGQELAARQFSFTTAAFANGLRLGLYQASTTGGSLARTDVAIDWVKLDSTPTVPQPLELGALAEGQRNSSQQRDSWSFELTSTTRVIMDPRVDSSALRWSLDAQGRGTLFERNFQERATDAPGNPVMELPPGRYTVHIHGNTTGSYGFRLVNLGAALPLTPGQAQSVTLSPGHATEVRYFDAQAGQRFYFDPQGATSNQASWRLVSPTGDLLFSRAIDSDFDTLALPLSGRYTLVFEGYRTAGAEPNVLNYGVQPVADHAATLVLDAVTSHTFNTPGGVAVYTLDLQTARRVRMDSLSPSTFRWSLTGPRGTVVAPTQLRWSDSADLGGALLELPPGIYTLTVDPAGDTVGSFAFRLVDVAGSTVAQATPGTAQEGTLSPGNRSDFYHFSANAGDRFFFDQQAAQATGGRVRLWGPYGNLVWDTAIGTDVDVFRLADAGRYTLAFEGARDESAANTYRFNLQPLPDRAPVPITALEGKPGADLTVEDVIVTAVGGGPIGSGGRVTVSWTDVNAGELPADGAWVDWLVLTRVDTGEVIETRRLPRPAADGPLASGGRQPRSVEITLPEGARGAGALRFSVTTDVDDTLREHNRAGRAETNNQTATVANSVLASYPDLVPQHLRVEPAGGGWTAGASVTVRWETANTGQRPAQGSWQETLVVRNLSNNQVLLTRTVLHDGSTLEGNGASLSRSETFDWPAAGAQGRIRFEVTVDSTGLLAESNPAGSGETNNIAQLLVPNAPDLVVQGLERVGGAQSGDTVTVRWRDVNAGNTAVPGSFRDRLRVVNTTTGEVLFDQALPYDATVSGLLLPGQSRDRLATFQLPVGSRGAGAISVTVTADASPQAAGTVLEANAANDAENNNSATLGFNALLSAAPNLSVVIDEAPDTGRGGTTVTVKWTVTNGGALPATGRWVDRLLLTTDGNPAHALLTIDVPHDGPLGTTASYQASAQVPLPLQRNGMLRWVVVTDATQQVTEPDTRADNTSQPRAISLVAPYTDLAVQLVQAPTVALAGAAIEVAWRVANGGDTAATGSWKDRVVLSQDDEFGNADDIVLGTVTLNGPLAAGASYGRRENFLLPPDLQGPWKVLVRTDLDGALFDDGRTSDNLRAADAVLTVRPAPAPNLVAQGVSGPLTALAGGAATVTWEVLNGGEAAATGPWVDYLYLSADGQLAGAVLLGSKQRSGSLAAGASYADSLQVQLPAWADVQARLIVVTDAGGKVFEAGRDSDNTRVDGTLGLRHLNLQAGGLTAPARVDSAQQLTVGFDVVQSGTAAASGTWTDRLYLSRDGTVDAGDRLLASHTATRSLLPGGGYHVDFDVTIPIDAEGAWQLIAVTDDGDALRELGHEADNRSLLSLQADLQAYADLQAFDIVAPTQLIADPARVTVSWSVRNHGTGAGLTDAWTDTVVLSTNTVFGDADDILLGSFRHEGGLAQGGVYSRTETMFAPPGRSGRFHVLVKTDAENQVFEHGGEADNTDSPAAPLDLMTRPYADLEMGGVSAQANAQSGGTVAVTWTVTNRGIGRTDTDRWTDEVVLTSDAAGQHIVKAMGFQHIGVLEVGGHYTRTGVVSLPDTFSGTLYAFVRTSGPFELVYTDNNRAAAPQPVQVAQSLLPDLRVIAISGPADAHEGDTVEVTWEVLNDGDARAAGSWTDTVVLVKAGADPADPATPRPITLGSFTHAAGLGAGNSYLRTERFKLPSRIEGGWQIRVTTDAGNSVFEGATEPANNTTLDDAVLMLSLLPRPDLQVQSVTAPAQATAGQTVAVTFTVVNRGPVAATGVWHDQVWFSPSGTMQGAVLLATVINDQALPATTGSYSTTASVVMPERYRGGGHFLVVADGGNAVEEYPQANERNNSASRAVNVVAQPSADLLTSNVVAPSQGVYGGEITVRWTVTNVNDTPTNRSSWTDTLWLTRDRTRPSPGPRSVLTADGTPIQIPGNAAILLGSRTHVGALSKDGSYDVELTVRLPQQIESGTWYLTPWADAYDAVLEDTLDIHVNADDPNEESGNNYKARAIDILGTPVLPLPDLQVTAVSTNATPDQPGSVDRPFEVTYTVRNEGEGPANGPWTDTVVLHDTPNLNDPAAKRWVLGTFDRPAGLASKTGYTVTRSFDLSPAAKGWYVTVLADTDPLRTIAETIENNNGRTVAAEVQARPADLKVITVGTPAQNFSGEKALISWTVQNVGAAVWSGTRAWTDAVFISPDPVFQPNSSRTRLLGTVTHPAGSGLASQASYQASAELALPAGFDGPYYVYVLTDYQPNSYPSPEPEAGGNGDSRGRYLGTVYEAANTANNLGRGDIQVTYREPDLKISPITLSATPVMSGQTVTVSFSVTNAGTRDTRQSIWTDRVYLSRDPSLDPNDLQLASFIRYGGLAAGQSYQRDAVVTIPGDTEGPWYLIAFTDSNVIGAERTGQAATVGLGQVQVGQDAVPEFRDEGNNIAVKAVDVVLSPAADLRVTVVTPSAAKYTRGQPIDFSYTVRNVGGAATPADARWLDRVYLSVDGNFDPNTDRLLGQIEHQGAVAANGGFYERSGSFRLPNDLTGSYYLFVETDPITSPGSQPRGAVFEGGLEGNNAGRSADPVLIQLPPPSDLQVRAVQVPSTGQTGGTVKIGWDVRNDHGATVSGRWTDALYLSLDDSWSLDDVLLGTLEQDRTLAAGQGYHAEKTVTLPPAREGQYRIVVRTDLRDQVVEGVDERNNDGLSTDKINLTVPELALGDSVSTTLSPGQERLYKVVVPAGHTLRLTLDGVDDVSANELYVRYADVATPASFDVGSTGVLAADARATVPTTQPGTYYVLVRGRSGPAASPVTLQASSLPFQVNDITVDQGGDSRWVTTTITGARFAPGTVVKLARAGIAEVEPTAFQVIDATRIIATFDLRHAPHGLYDVVVTHPDGTVATLPYRYLVEAALPIDVSIGLGGSRVLPAGQTGVYNVTLKSLTNVDTPYVYFNVGASELGDNAKVFGLPYVTFSSNVRGGPDNGQRTDVAWATLDSETNTTGRLLAAGYALDLSGGGNVGFSFTVTSYPGLKALYDRDFEGYKRALYEARPDIAKLDPLKDGVGSLGSDLAAYFSDPNAKLNDDCVDLFMPFLFNVSAAATPLTRDEFVMLQTQQALRLRDAILQDPTANAALVNLAAGSGRWVDAYLGALEESGLLRQEDQAPPIREDAKVISLMAVLSSGVLVGPAGHEIAGAPSLAAFFEQVHRWYGDAPRTMSPLVGVDLRESIDCGEYGIPVPKIPTADMFDMKLSRPTHFQALNIFSPGRGAGADLTVDPGFSSLQSSDRLTALELQALFDRIAQKVEGAAIVGPTGQGDRQYVPADTALPYTVRFSNPAEAAITANEVRIETRLDDHLSLRSFRLGDLRIGGINVSMPPDRANYQGDIDLRNSLGFILRISAGVDPVSRTASWVLQAIDPLTGEVMRDATRGLLPPDNSQGRGAGFVSYSVQAAFGATTGQTISAKARVALDTRAVMETAAVTHWMPMPARR